MDLAAISGAVLAGGRSFRMGADKAGLLLNGKPFLQIQAEKLAGAGIKDILICCGRSEEVQHLAESIRLSGGAAVRTVKDEAPGLGPLEGIRTALSASANQLCFILSVDAVLLKPQTIRRLADLAEGTRSPVTLLSKGGSPEPLIGVYSKSVLAAAEDCLRSGRLAVRSLFDAHPPLLLELPEGDLQTLNCNTPEDYETVCGIYKEQR